MSAVTSISAAKTHSGSLAADQGSGDSQPGRPLVSLVVSVYNEAAILAVVRAYQERAGWHKRTPTLSTTPITTTGD